MKRNKISPAIDLTRRWGCKLSVFTNHTPLLGGFYSLKESDLIHVILDFHKWIWVPFVISTFCDFAFELYIIRRL